MDQRIHDKLVGQQMQQTVLATLKSLEEVRALKQNSASWQHMSIEEKDAAH